MLQRFNFMATGIGSLPLQNPLQACRLILEYLPEMPHWPQLPKINPLEGMIEQFLEGAPGVVKDEGRLYLRPLEPYEEWERFYLAFEGEDLEAFAISSDRAVGLYPFLEEVVGKNPPFVKGQITGPITLGFSLKDPSGAAAFFHPDLRDMLIKLCAMKARWQEVNFKRVLPNSKTIIFVDEPILASYGSVFMNVGKDEVISTLRATIAALCGLKGIHICGNTDWPMIMEVGLDIVDFDAYNYLSSFLLYPQQIKDFLNGGGAIAWGIVPTEEEALRMTDPSSLAIKLREGIEELVASGVDYELLANKSLITPSCGTASLSEEAARRVYALTADLTKAMR